MTDSQPTEAAAPQNAREFQVWEHGRRQGIEEGMRAQSRGCVCPGLRSPLLIPGETWFPQLSSAKPRKIVWVGEDEYRGDAVRWIHPGESKSSIMQDKAFRWWIKKHGAKL